MPANWSSYAVKLKSEFGTPNLKTISDIADIHATEYVNAVLQSQILISGSQVSLMNKSLIKPAFELTFNALKAIKDPIKPNYANGEAQTEEEKNSRNFLENIFLVPASAICATWSTEIFTPISVPPGYVSPSPGYSVVLPGIPTELAKDLAKAFFISQDILNGELAINTMVASLIEAYAKHMLTIGIVFIGLVPAAPSPVLGPPLPLVGVI